MNDSEQVSLTQLAAYCLEYANLAAGTSMRTGSATETPDIWESILDIKKLFFEDIKSDSIYLNLLTNISLNPDSESSEMTEDEIALYDRYYKERPIADKLDTINHKYRVNSYTKQILLQTGFIKFEAERKTNNKAQENQSGNGFEIYSEPLFSVPVKINYSDSRHGRRYSLEILDESITVSIDKLKYYLPQIDYDEIFSYIISAESSGKNMIPISELFVEELWGKIKFLLEKNDAINISESPILSRSRICLSSKPNFFLAQDLNNLSSMTEEDLSMTSLNAWSLLDEDSESIEIKDDGSDDLFFPFPYDKHQLKILGILNNKAVVVEGPPGTGKSQTIANLAIHLASTGKKVLFVSQKDQAVRGVKDKLKLLRNSNEEKIPHLFGYIPDRTSLLNTEDDIRDSAVNALIALNQSCANIAFQNPKELLKIVNQDEKKFNNYVIEDRLLYQLYAERRDLDYVSEFKKCAISQAWWDSYICLEKKFEGYQKEILKYKTDNADFISEKEEHYKVPISLGVNPSKIIDVLQSVIDDVQMIVPNRSSKIRKILSYWKLSNTIKKKSVNIEEEIWCDIELLIKSDTTKAEKMNDLISLKEYFDYLIKRLSFANLNMKLVQMRKDAEINSEMLVLLKNKINEFGVKKICDDIECYKIINTEIEKKKCLYKDINGLNKVIKDVKKNYRTNICDYVRNRILSKTTKLMSIKKNRAILNRVASALKKSKKAYKTFDKLKSDYQNFEVMSQLLPIWMMSLDDVSRIIPMKSNIFDYVIIDEASQCNLAYAFPVMYRAEHAIFFGDSLQMRDNNTLFKSNEQLAAIAKKHKIPDYYQIKAEEDSVKSVMDIAFNAGFKRITLRNHYRSPKEIIGFSNENFYAPEKRTLEVVNDSIFTYGDTNRTLVNHVVEYDSNLDKTPKTNMSEVMYIKKLINGMKKNSAYNDKSIAVLSFFNAQAELLHKEINDDDIKVATIEGIQGDERDICIYSLVIRNTKEKSMYMALTGEGGEIRKGLNAGRVNVAFSRAKLQVHCVTSIEPKFWPNGIWIKRYLDYIDNHGIINRAIASEQQFDSKFEENVFNYLNTRLDSNQFYLKTQVKSCGFRIDLVVTNKLTNKKLAIECDGPHHFENGDGQIYVSSDWERQYALEIAGWNFYRLSYFDWQENQKDAKDNLTNYIDEYFKVASSQIEPAYKQVNIKETSIDIHENENMPQAIAKFKDNDSKRSVENCSLSSPKIYGSSDEITRQSKRIPIINDWYVENLLNQKNKEKHDETESLLNQKKKKRQLSNGDSLLNTLKRSGISFIDNRDKSNIIWILCNDTYQLDVEEVVIKNSGYTYTYEQRGSVATGNKPAWRIMVNEKRSPNG